MSSKNSKPTETKTTKSGTKSVAKAKTKIDEILAAMSGNKEAYRIEKGNTIIRKDKRTSGSLELDAKLEGGIIKGKIVEVFGPESLGKTALAYTMLAHCDGVTVYIDGESNYDEASALMYGVKTENLIVIKPEYAEAAMEAILDLVKQGVDMIVYDSIAGLSPKVEMEGSMEDHNVGKKASRMGQLMRKLHLEADDTGTIIFFINQIRDTLSPYGPSHTTPGGKALKFHSSYRIEFTGRENIGPQGAEPIGHYINFKVVKNKFARPGQKGQIPLIYGSGISKEWELIDLALEKGIIQKSGSWYAFEEVKLAQGQFNTMQMLQDNPDLFKEIKEKLDQC